MRVRLRVPRLVPAGPCWVTVTGWIRWQRRQWLAVSPQFWRQPAGIENRTELDNAEYEHADLGCGRHGGHARTAVEETHLTEELAGSQLAHAPVRRLRQSLALDFGSIPSRVRRVLSAHGSKNLA
jgi:hypothetical protein